MSEKRSVEVPEAIPVDDRSLRARPLPVPQEGDKEARGRVLVVAGSIEIPGPAVLSATAALRAGAGKVAVATPRRIAQSVAFSVPESRVFGLDESAEGGIEARKLNSLDVLHGNVKAVLLGPGLPYSDATVDLVLALTEKFPEAVFILDAGAMNIVKREPAAGTRLGASVLLTPHAGEMASLTGNDKEEIRGEPERTALDAAAQWKALVALKGAVTFVATPQGHLWKHEGGSIGLATSGSGDVLAGIIAGLAARGTPLEEAAVWGIALHARAGKRLAKKVGPLGFLAREIAAEVPALMAELAASE